MVATGRLISPTVELYQLDRDVCSELATCHALVEAVDIAIAALSEAGSNLQRKISEVKSADLPDEVAPCVLKAFSTVGVELVGLAAALTGEVVRPIQDLVQAIEVDHEQGRLRLDELRHQEVLCSNAFQEQKRRKEQALQGLATALLTCQKLEEDQPIQRSSWFFPFDRSSYSATGAEAKLQDIANEQNKVLKAFADATEDAEEAKLNAREAERSFRERLTLFKMERRSLLKSCLRRCSGAWGKMGESFRNRAADMSSTATALEDAQGCDSTMVSICPEATREPSASSTAQPEAGLEESTEKVVSTVQDHSDRSLWQFQIEARELHLLEKETSLLRLEEKLEAERKALEERRRCLALDHARHISMFDHYQRSAASQASAPLQACLSGPLDVEDVFNNDEGTTVSMFRK